MYAFSLDHSGKTKELLVFATTSHLNNYLQALGQAKYEDVVVPQPIATISAEPFGDKAWTVFVYDANLSLMSQSKCHGSWQDALNQGIVNWTAEMMALNVRMVTRITWTLHQHG